MNLDTVQHLIDQLSGLEKETKGQEVTVPKSTLLLTVGALSECMKENRALSDALLHRMERKQKNGRH